MFSSIFLGEITTFADSSLAEMSGFSEMQARMALWFAVIPSPTFPPTPSPTFFSDPGMRRALKVTMRNPWRYSNEGGSMP